MTGFPERPKAKMVALDRWKIGFEKMLSGDKVALAQMLELTKEVEAAHPRTQLVFRSFVFTLA